MPLAVPSREQAGVILSYREMQTISYLRSHAGAFVPASELAEAIWGDDADEALSYRIVQRVRQKLGPTYIESSAFGYRLTYSRAATVAMVCSNCGAEAVNYSSEWVCYGCTGTQNVDLEVGRAAYAEGTNSGKPWTRAEREFVLAHLADMSLEELGDAVNRTESAVRGFLAQEGIKKPYVRTRPR